MSWFLECANNAYKGHGRVQPHALVRFLGWVPMMRMVLCRWMPDPACMHMAGLALGYTSRQGVHMLHPLNGLWGGLLLALEGFLCFYLAQPPPCGTMVVKYWRCYHLE